MRDDSPQKSRKPMVRPTVAALSSLTLAASLLAGASSAQAVTVACNASDAGEFTTCWTNVGPDVTIKLTGDITLSDRVVSSGGKLRTIDVNGKELSALKGIQVIVGDQFVVDDTMGGGTLNASDGGSAYDAAIGGDGNPMGAGEDAGSVRIKKGNVIAEAPDLGAGIGGGFGTTSAGTGGTVTIDGGTLAATGGSVGVGIGGGRSDTADGGDGGSVTVNGGYVTATGGTYATGIGGGTSNSTIATGGAGATIIVNGGTVNAVGGNFSAAIGGGAGKTGGDSTGGDGGSLTVNGGSVIAVGVDQASTGIGGAAGDSGGAGGSVTVNGGSVTATAGAFATGIGGGLSLVGAGGTGATVNINGGEVKATGGFGQSPEDDVTSGSGIGSGVGYGGGAGAPGSLRVGGTKAADSLTTGGQGGTNSQAPSITFAASANKKALVTEVAGAVPPQGSAHIRFIEDPKPPSPPQPTAKKKQHLRAGAAPKRVKFRGVTVLNKRKATTREGRPLKAKATIASVRGELRCARVVRGPQRKLSIRTYGQCNFRLTVTYTAPGNSTLHSLRVVKRYRVRS